MGRVIWLFMLHLCMVFCQGVAIHSGRVAPGCVSTGDLGCYRITPHPLYAVVVPLLLVENMHDHIEIVQNNQPSGIHSFLIPNFFTQFIPGFVHHVFGQCQDKSISCSMIYIYTISWMCSI